jgi:putative DNA primase/helicase
MDFDAIRQRFSLRDQLIRYGARIGHDGRYKCVIPGHKDKNPSASYSKRNGVEHWHCFACDRQGDVIDLVAAVEGLSIGEAARHLAGDAPSRPYEAPPRPKPEPEELGLVFDLVPVPDDAPAIRAGAESPPILSKRGKISSVVPQDVYAYFLPDRTKVGLVLRVPQPEGGKKHLPVRWARERGWVWAGWSGDDVPPLYNAPAIVDRPEAPILVVEGEKCCKLARALFRDFVVTCWLGGTAGVKKANLSLLRGREVTFWPDNDEPGIAAMKAVLAKSWAARSWWVEPSQDWPRGHDVADLIKEEGAEGALSYLMATRIERTPLRHEPGALPPPGSWLEVGHGGWLPDELTVDLTKELTLNVRSELNAILALRHHPAFQSLSFDIIRRQILFQGEPANLRNLQYELMHHTQVRLGITSVAAAVEDVASERPVNPLATRLRALQWDGIRRPLAGYAGARQNAWTEAAFERWFVGLIRRILEPGCQHDLMLVLEGEQGVGKTSFLRVLAQGLGFDGYMILYKLNTDSEHAMMQLNGKLIVELAEMVAYRKGDREAFKALISAKTDHYRRPYARDYVDLPRCCVFAGTTNNLGNYLTDTSGNRRIVPVRTIYPAQTQELSDDLEQVYAEGVARYDALTKAGAEINWFNAAELEVQELETENRELPSILAETLNFHLTTAGDSFDMGTVWKWLEIAQPRDRKVFLPELVDEMRRRGWTYSKGGTREDRTWRWRRLKL